MTVPAGSTVAFSRHSLHRRADFWRRPTEFNPERFRPGAEENPRSAYAYVPFGGGPRVCVGIHFAIQELIVLVAVLARRYRLEIDRQQRHDAHALLTMRLKDGLRVRLAQR